MTEVEWLAASDPTPMLAFLKSKASDRKLRLFAVSCCRRLWHLLDDDYGRPALESCEQCAEGLMSVDDLWALGNKNEISTNYDLHELIAQRMDIIPGAVSAAFLAVGLTMGMTGWRQVTTSAERAAGTVARLGMGSKADDFAYEEQEEYEQAALPFAAPEKNAQATLLRDIFDNPFRLASIDSTWLTSDVRILAEGIYRDRAFDRMPILADALQDAGCDNEGILTHCRSEGPHVRGCWVVDLVLGKS